MEKDRRENVCGHLPYDRIPSYSPSPATESIRQGAVYWFLNESGDRMEITEAVITNFNARGELIGEPNKIPTKAHGVRIPLEVLPTTALSLPIPTASQ